MHQKAVLIQVLLAFPEQRVAVEYFASVGDALAYAQDFLTIFKAVGWSVGDVESVERRTAQDAGLALIVSQDHRLPPAAEAFRDALRIYGIEVETVLDDRANFAANSFLLAIGSDAYVVVTNGGHRQECLCSLENGFDFGVDRDVGCRNAVDGELLAGGLGEVEKAADVIVLVVTRKNALGFGGV